MRGELPVQTMELRSSISTVSLPRVKPQPKQSCSELSRACSKRGGGENGSLEAPKANGSVSQPEPLEY